MTLLGRILLGVTITFINVILSTIIGVTLNFASVKSYRSYVRVRRSKEESHHHNKATTSIAEIQVVVSTSKAKKLAQKEINENKAERNMLKWR